MISKQITQVLANLNLECCYDFLKQVILYKRMMSNVFFIILNDLSDILKFTFLVSIVSIQTILIYNINSLGIDRLLERLSADFSSMCLCSGLSYSITLDS